MQVHPIQTRKFLPPQDDLFSVFDGLNMQLREGSVLALSSKIVAIHQGRCVPIPNDPKEAHALKDTLAEEESELFLPKDETAPYPRMFTVYEGTFGSASGIDESNSDGYFTLLPRDCMQTARDIRAFLCDKHRLEALGVIITDSRSYPMRNGTVGVSLGYAGFRPLHDYRGRKDIFDREMKFERLNVADCLATTATCTMGEGNECTPIVHIYDIGHIVFEEKCESNDTMLTLKTTMADDVFGQFYGNAPWQKGGRYDG